MPSVCRGHAENEWVCENGQATTKNEQVCSFSVVVGWWYWNSDQLPSKTSVLARGSRWLGGGAGKNWLGGQRTNERKLCRGRVVDGCGRSVHGVVSTPSLCRCRCVIYLKWGEFCSIEYRRNEIMQAYLIRPPTRPCFPSPFRVLLARLCGGQQSCASLGSSCVVVAEEVGTLVTLNLVSRKRLKLKKRNCEHTLYGDYLLLFVSSSGRGCVSSWCQNRRATEVEEGSSLASKLRELESRGRPASKSGAGDPERPVLLRKSPRLDP